MLGRSDGVLKPFFNDTATTEIYTVLIKFFAREVEDAVCVGRRREGDRDEAVCLFVVMCEGKEFDDELRSRIQKVCKTLAPGSLLQTPFPIFVSWRTCTFL